MLGSGLWGVCTLVSRYFCISGIVIIIILCIGLVVHVCVRVRSSAERGWAGKGCLPLFPAKELHRPTQQPRHTRHNATHTFGAMAAGGGDEGGAGVCVEEAK